MRLPNGIELLYGRPENPLGIPFVASSEGQLIRGLANSRAARQIRRVGKRVSSSTEGPLLGFVDGVERVRPVVQIQSNRGPFFRSRHGTSDPRRPIWRDAYYGLTYLAASQACQRWETSAIEISHPTGFAWPPQLAEVVVEALWNLPGTDPLDRVFFHPCCLTLARLRGAIATIRNDGDQNSGHRPLTWTQVDDAVVRLDLGSR